MNSRYAAICLLMTAALPAAAQYDQDITVEGKYVPEYIPQDRIGVFPKPIKFPAETSALTYSLVGINADFTPQAVPIQATGWRDSRSFSSKRGYLDLGIGSWLESTLSAGYRIIDSRESALGIRLQHNSISLWKPKVVPEGNPLRDTRQWRYDESVGLYGHHNFSGKGRLDAAVDYHIGNFDYYGFNPAGTPVSAEVPDQILNDVSGHISWHSPAGADRLMWNIAAGVRYFGYRRFYFPADNSYFAEALTGGRETHSYIGGGINFPTSAKSSLGLDLNADIIAYGNYEYRGTTAALSIPYSTPDTYGMLSLTPYYRFNRDRLDIRIGARVDLTFNAGDENDRYGFFHIAPDIKADYNAGPAQLFLHLGGGSRLHTLASTYDLDYYQTPAIFDTDPVYTPLDADLGINFGPFSGFEAGFDVAYRISRGQYFGGMYQCMLNNTAASLLNLPSEADGHPLDYSILPDQKSNLHGLSVGLHLGYDAGRYFSVKADGRYQPQKGTTGYFNGFDRPRWLASAAIESNPWNTLRLRLGCEFRGGRGFPVNAWYADSSPLNSNLIIQDNVPNLLMLNFGASYGITDNFAIWIQADNLLNRRTLHAPELPTSGLRLAAGISLMW